MEQINEELRVIFDSAIKRMIGETVEPADNGAAEPQEIVYDGCKIVVTYNKGLNIWNGWAEYNGWRGRIKGRDLDACAEELRGFVESVKLEDI